ncbi:MAG: IS30 family transposase [Butyrivibrio sp.]|nr:IS30 family transposase [Butyrivibrio sp.]
MKKPTKQPKYHRLNDEARFKIQHFLDDGVIVSDIAKKLHLPTSTVTREIKRHTTIEKHNGNDCQHYKSCKEAYACKKKCGTRRCRLCKSVECYKVCSNYSPGYCSKLCDESPHVCNGCASLRSCRYEKQLYRAKVADKQAKATDHEKLSHYRLNDEQVQELNRLISPLITEMKQSPRAALTAIKDELSFKVSLSTLYRLIDDRYLDCMNMDLPEKVSRKRRKPTKKARNKDAYAVLAVEKKGRMYTDFCEYIKTHEVVGVEMDCVEGRKTDTAVILSLHWKKYHMQLYFILEAHDAEHVVDMLDQIETMLGLELFRACLPVILTDNGEEFTDIEGMERSCTEPGEKRTMIFFCEPNRSDQKGSCERNHKLLRRIIPKRTSWDDSRNMSIQGLMQPHMVLATNHVNSYPRPDLGDRRPYDLAFKALPEEFFDMLNLEMIPPKEVKLHPSLIYNVAA